SEPSANLRTHNVVIQSSIIRFNLGTSGVLHRFFRSKLHSPPLDLLVAKNHLKRSNATVTVFPSIPDPSWFALEVFIAPAACRVPIFDLQQSSQTGKLRKLCSQEAGIRDRQLVTRRGAGKTLVAETAIESGTIWQPPCGRFESPTGDQYWNVIRGVMQDELRSAPTRERRVYAPQRTVAFFARLPSVSVPQRASAQMEHC
ncbi:unnamed protein product, partial [Cyprideis torosa]